MFFILKIRAEAFIY